MNGDTLMRSNNFFYRASQAANFGENLFPRRRHVLHAAKADCRIFFDECISIFKILF